MKHLFNIALILAMTMACGKTMNAQNLSLETNLVGYACLGTMNAEGSCAVARHWTVNAGARYNPFAWNLPSGRMQLKQLSVSAGTRFWLWHVYSGWWLSGKAQYQQYNVGGILSDETREGDRAGAVFSAGYTHMISPKFNITFGAGAWGGMDWYKKYDCPVCGLTIDSGRKPFFMPDDLIIAISYVF